MQKYLLSIIETWLSGLTKSFLEASLNQKGPKGEFIVVIYSESYAVIEYEGVKLRREAKEHAAREYSMRSNHLLRI